MISAIHFVSMRFSSSLVLVAFAFLLTVCYGVDLEAVIGVDMSGIYPSFGVYMDGRIHVTAKLVDEGSLNSLFVKMRENATSFLGKNVTRAVVAVPINFDDVQRQAIKNAGVISGLTVVQIIDSPTAACTAYWIHCELQDKTIVVYDLGRATFHATVLTTHRGVIQVLASKGDLHLGGEQFDNRLIQHFRGMLPLRPPAESVQILRGETEKVKHALSTHLQTRIKIEALWDGEEFSETITRATFEKLNNDLFFRTLTVLTDALNDSGLKAPDVDEIVLVGGSTRIPKIRSLLSNFFHGKTFYHGIKPEEVVAVGAAEAGLEYGVVEEEPVTQVETHAQQTGERLMITWPQL